MGYVNDLKVVHQEDTDEETITGTKDMPKLRHSEVNIRDYHKILEVILQDLKTLQSKGKIRFNLNYKGTQYKLNLITVVGPIIWDTSGHDVLVGRYSGRTNVARICRYCDCHYNDSDDPDVEFNYTMQEDIQKLYIDANMLIAK